MNHYNVCAIILLLTINLACKQENTILSNGINTPQTGQQNVLKMNVNGQRWESDHDVFGAFHPKGYEKAIIIAGGKGEKDASEQAFNLNLYFADGVGKYHLVTGNEEKSVVQMGNWSSEAFLCGSMMGFEFDVDIKKASKNPTIIEAVFEGKMMCNNEFNLEVTNGYFYYQE